jgi:hypothetical protein
MDPRIKSFGSDWLSIESAKDQLRKAIRGALPLVQPCEIPDRSIGTTKPFVRLCNLFSRNWGGQPEHRQLFFQTSPLSR